MNNLSSMIISSMGFKDGSRLPKRYCGNEENMSPPICWDRAPRNAKTMAIVCTDAAMPQGLFTHWVVYNIPPFMIELPENMPKDRTVKNGIMQAINDYRKVGWEGPKFPAGTHKYRFTVYALDTDLKLPYTADAKDLINAMRGHVLEEASITAFWP